MADQINTGDIIQNIAAQMSGAVTRQFISPTKVIVFFPGGVPYHCIDGLGYITPSGLLKLAEGSRTAVISPLPGDPRSFLELEAITKSLLYFIVVMDLRAEPELYKRELPKAPAWMEIELTHVGKSSFTTSSRMFLKNVDKPVAESSLMCVLVDPTTRSPVPLPQWWCDKFASESVKAAKSIRFQSHPLPKIENNDDSVGEYSFQVPFSDSDFNAHANFTSYAKYCYDAVMFHETRIKGARRGVGRVQGRHVKEMALRYKGEVAMGNELKVRLKQSEGENDTFHFWVQQSKTSQVVAECRMELYPVLQAAKL